MQSGAVFCCHLVTEILIDLVSKEQHDNPEFSSSPWSPDCQHTTHTTVPVSVRVRKLGSGGQKANINVCALFVRANVWQGALRGLFFNDDVAAEPKWSQVINK